MYTPLSYIDLYITFTAEKYIIKAWCDVDGIRSLKKGKKVKWNIAVLSRLCYFIVLQGRRLLEAKSNKKSHYWSFFLFPFPIHDYGHQIVLFTQQWRGLQQSGSNQDTKKKLTVSLTLAYSKGESFFLTFLKRMHKYWKCMMSSH